MIWLRTFFLRPCRAGVRMLYLSLLLLLGSVYTQIADAATFNVNITTDAPNASPSSRNCATAAGLCSLRAAVQAANALGGNNTINLPAGVYVLTVAGAGEDAAATGDLDITTGTLTIQGAGNDTSTGTVINANGSAGIQDRVFEIMSGATATFSNLVIENGVVHNAEGGGIYNAGGTAASPVTLNNVTVTGNIADNPNPSVDNAGDGGGIYNAGVMLLETTTVSNNISNSNGLSSSTNGGGGGGGIYNQGALTVQSGSVITNNTTEYFQNNTANNVGGGGIQNSGGPSIQTTTAQLTVESSSITNNSAPSGGGIRNSFGNMLIDLTTLDGNSANTGGGLQNAGGSATLNRSTVSNNKASETTDGQNGIGGGISNLDTMNVSSSSIVGNSADQEGGGIDNSAQGTIQIVNSTVYDNTANYNNTANQGQGGGIYSHINGSANEGQGGGIRYTMNITNATIYDNVAPGGGTEIFVCGTEDESLGLTCANDTVDPSTNLVDVKTSIVNSIVGNSTTTDNCGGDPADLIATLGYNIETANTCGFIPLTPTTPTGSDLINVDFTTLFSSPFQNNGGPTSTLAISTSSPAYNGAGPNDAYCPSIDQRGFARNNASDGICDIGAYEVSTTNTNFNVVDLSLQVSAALRTTSGVQVIYTFTITNLGVIPATGTKLIATLPPWAVIPTDGGFPNTSCSTTSTGFQCDLGVVGGLTTQQIYVVADPQQSGELILSADVESTEEDSYRPDNLASVTIDVPSVSAGGQLSGNNFFSSNNGGGGVMDGWSLLALLAASLRRRRR